MYVCLDVLESSTNTYYCCSCRMLLCSMLAAVVLAVCACSSRRHCTAASLFIFWYLSSSFLEEIAPLVYVSQHSNTFCCIAVYGNSRQENGNTLSEHVKAERGLLLLAV